MLEEACEAMSLTFPLDFVHVQVRRKAMRDCEADFGATLSQQSAAAMPSAQLLARLANESLQGEGSPPSHLNLLHTCKVRVIISLIT